jgi:hypothetical protein
MIAEWITITARRFSSSNTLSNRGFPDLPSPRP